MVRPFSKAQLVILQALHSGDRLHSAGGFTFFAHDSRQCVPTPIFQALRKAGLIDLDSHPFYCISEAGLKKLKELQEAALKVKQRQRYYDEAYDLGQYYRVCHPEGDAHRLVCDALQYAMTADIDEERINARYDGFVDGASGFERKVYQETDHEAK